MGHWPLKTLGRELGRRRGDRDRGQQLSLTRTIPSARNRTGAGHAACGAMIVPGVPLTADTIDPADDVTEASSAHFHFCPPSSGGGSVSGVFSWPSGFWRAGVDEAANPFHVVKRVRDTSGHCGRWGILSPSPHRRSRCFEARRRYKHPNCNEGEVRWVGEPTEIISNVTGIAAMSDLVALVIFAPPAQPGGARPGEPVSVEIALETPPEPEPPKPEPTPAELPPPPPPPSTPPPPVEEPPHRIFDPRGHGAEPRLQTGTRRCPQRAARDLWNAGRAVSRDRRL